MVREPLTYFNGRFLPAAQAVLSLNDLGFVWGATVTDRLRTFRQKLFRLDDHLQRFRSSCDHAFVPQPRDNRELANAAEELVAANARLLPANSELSLVIFATPGEAGEPTLGMQARPLDVARYTHFFANGAILVPTNHSMSADELNPHIKHRSRLTWWIAQQKIRCKIPQNEKVEPLFTTASPERFIRETAIANFLLEKDGAIVSPPRSQILDGISLRVVEELCNNLGIAFAEQELKWSDAKTAANECMLTCTSFCVAPVGRLGDVPLSTARPMFQRLIQAWSDMVGVDIRREFST